MSKKLSRALGCRVAIRVISTPPARTHAGHYGIAGSVGEAFTYPNAALMRDVASGSFMKYIGKPNTTIRPITSPVLLSLMIPPPDPPRS